ncbi:hypothetical protein ELH53_35960 [Rhizobium ruizarguesonis]|nr:hypothetical protein ELH53_35960 [Rhizobium ruizarguesonis]TBB32954.1 hypothetical protein ELH47_14130 [Rhizobium ruizarguesonis]TBC19423.1 hypothetical protein ELH34_04125 [Rhizobium ruizarguesonis]TBD53054.1 hypothetical protein ELH22_34455 [Rhizobium ruizarguesonis]TBD73291.1 hypothetical protein ELH11_34640 [Rhizobium ruizarguesonis]
MLLRAAKPSASFASVLLSISFNIFCACLSLDVAVAIRSFLVSVFCNNFLEDRLATGEFASSKRRRLSYMTGLPI